MTSLYSLRRLSHDEYSITKFDRDYNPEGTYALSKTECSCPQSHRDRCRHRTMLPLFLGLNHVDDGWFLDWDTRQWQAPINMEPAPLTEEQNFLQQVESNHAFRTEQEQFVQPLVNKINSIVNKHEASPTERFASAYESESSNAALATSAPTQAIKRRKI